MLKLGFKIFGGTVLFLVGFVICYFTTAYLLSRVRVNSGVSSTVNKEDDITIYILSNGVHTDIVVPIKSSIIDWSRYIKFENTVSKDTSFQYVAIGWGDRGFYLETPSWKELQFDIAFKAAFGLSESAIHTTFHKMLKEQEKCKAISISLSMYQSLVDYILASFKMDDLGNTMFIQTDANYGNNDSFYQAKGKYSLFYTCNTWANNALKSCDQKASFWTPFESGIFYNYR